MKITSGSNEEISNFVDKLYSSIVTAGTYKASSIRVAEAAKVIENVQRDVNIALINELAILFDKLKIDTEEVLEAAETKWNFLPFRPGLVGGHCIGVDPYYLTHKAQTVNHYPEVILAGRRINDAMPSFVVSKLIKCMIKERINIVGSRVLIMGLTFKEDCPDLRNSKVVDIVKELEGYGVSVEVIDPWCSVDEAEDEHKIKVCNEYKQSYYDAIILAVAHEKFKLLGIKEIRRLGKPKHIVYDVKHLFNKDSVDIRL